MEMISFPSVLRWFSIIFVSCFGISLKIKNQADKISDNKVKNSIGKQHKRQSSINASSVLL